LKIKRPEELRDLTTSKELCVQGNDTWIAAQAIQHNLVSVSNDKMKLLMKVSHVLAYPHKLISWE